MPGVSQANPVQRVGALGHRQQPVDRHAAADPAFLQPGHLIRHQRDQGRDDDRQRTGLVVARQRRDLVAERLPRTRGKNPEHVPPSHRLLNDGALHRPSVVRRRFGTKTAEAEPALQFLSGVMPLPAPAAGRIAASRVSKAVHQPSGLRELMADPGRHHRVAAGHGEPRQGVGQ